MPIYEYECESCQDIIEARQSLSDKPMTTCPRCGGPLKKLISQSSFQLKGGGWYADGYSSKSAGSQKSCASKSAEGKTEAPACGKSSSSCKCC